MSDGATPHSEVENLAVLTEMVKNGKNLAKPPNCPQRVYSEMLVPCWNSVPTKRPSFAELLQVGQSLGGVIGEREFHNVQSDDSRDRDNLANQKLYPPDFWATSDGRKLRGVSVAHIAQDFFPAAQNAALGQSFEHDDPVQRTSLTVTGAVRVFVMPRCVGITCPRDGDPGCAYVDTLTGEDHVGPSAAMLSYFWTYSMVDVVDALTDWTRENERNPARTYIWMDALCLNQHRFGVTPSADKLADEFASRVTSIGRILPLLAPWDKPV